MDTRLDEPTAATSDRRRLLVDLASSYGLSVARVASMAAIIALLYRHTDATYVAIFVVCRSMLGVLNYAFSGIAPATLHAIHDRLRTDRHVVAAVAETARGGAVVEYRPVLAVARRASDPISAIYASSGAIAAIMSVVGCVVVWFYAERVPALHSIPNANGYAWQASGLALTFGVAILVRLMAEPSSAVLQANGRLAVDNLILILAELAWPYLLWCYIWEIHTPWHIFHAFVLYVVPINLLAGLARMFAARVSLGMNRGAISDFDVGAGAAILHRALIAAVAAFADFLYAPFNLLLIQRALGPISVTDYTPALQFDAALLLLVGAIAATMLPRAMWLAGARRHADLRSLYLRSTLASLAILAAAAVATWLAAPTVLRLWLGQPMPATLAVLPFVLLHTVIGGTAGVGRATLLAMGRFRAYTVSAIVGGVANVGLALGFVVGLGWGLRGVALATVVAVFGRCAVWMPWYILRALRDDPTPPPDAAASDLGVATRSPV